MYTRFNGEGLVTDRRFGMQLNNGILAVSLVLGTLTLPSLVGAGTPPGDVVKEADAKSGCLADRHAVEPQKPVPIENCAGKLTAGSSSKAKNQKPVPVETPGSTLSLTTRAAHPRR